MTSTPTLPTGKDDAEPVAWIHTLVMDMGENAKRLSFSKESPFGVRGVDYSGDFEVISYPLVIAHPPIATGVDEGMVERAIREWRRVHTSGGAKGFHEAMRASLEAAALTAPAGDGSMVLVPREPTDAMLLAFHAAVHQWMTEHAEEDDFASDKRVWRAMLSASPSGGQKK